MGLYSAMLAGVAGLQSNSTALAAISENIANVNTVGYKDQSVDFQTLVTNTGNAAAFSAGTPGAAAVSTSISWLTTATVAVARSEMSCTTPARSASCMARPERCR